MTMDLDRAFSLNHEFGWETPINAMTQQSIAAYGNDEDRVRLASHFSVSLDSLEVMSLVTSPEVKLAVIQNRSTPTGALVRLSHDHDRFVRAAAKHAIAELPEKARVAAKAMDESPLQRLRSRISA